jgi:hypothetical protein
LVTIHSTILMLCFSYYKLFSPHHHHQLYLHNLHQLHPLQNHSLQCPISEIRNTAISFKYIESFHWARSIGN